MLGKSVESDGALIGLVLTGEMTNTFAPFYAKLLCTILKYSNILGLLNKLK